MFWSLSSSCFRFLWFRRLDCPHICHRAAVLRSWKKLTIKDFTLKKLNLINSSSYYNWLFINVTLNPAVEQLHIGQPKQRRLSYIMEMRPFYTIVCILHWYSKYLCVYLLVSSIFQYPKTHFLWGYGGISLCNPVLHDEKTSEHSQTQRFWSTLR